jgi:hypothetical protein
LVCHLEGKNTLRVFENKMLREMFSLKRGEVKGGWRKWNGEHRECDTERNSSRQPEGKRLLGVRRRRWEKILKWILKKWDGRPQTGLIWLMLGTDCWFM